MGARENILGRIKTAQLSRGEIREMIPDFTSEIYNKLDNSLIVEFKKNLELVAGRVFICESRAEVTENIRRLLVENNEFKINSFDTELSEILPTEAEIVKDKFDFDDLKIAVTNCEFLIAHLGSILISSAQTAGRRLNVYPEIHIIIAKKSQICGFLEDGLKNIQIKYKNNLPSLISNITGPSRTADIEKTLVMGMHGPKQLAVIIYSDF